MKEPYLVLLYYCYTNISNPNKFREKHHLFCIDNNLKGRIIVSKEGINGDLELYSLGKRLSLKKELRS